MPLVKYVYIILLFMSAIPGYLPAQNTLATNYKENYKVRITKTTEAIKIAGDFT